MNGTIYLIDSSIWIEVFPPRRSASPTELIERIDGLVSRNGAAITGLIRFEVLDGARNEAEFNRLEAALDGLPRIPTAESAWEDAARISFQLRRRGWAVPASDVAIAAVALQTGLTLIHRDRHFDTIAAHTSLRVESHV